MAYTKPRKPILAIDVDGVTFASGERWLSWCNAMYDKQLTPKDFNYNYNLCEVFGKSAIDFWATEDLYGKIPLVEGAKESIYQLHEDGWDIAFVTYCKKGHFGNKCEKLKELFPFLLYINVTKEKAYSVFDVLIDDRVDNFVGQGADKHCILFETPWTQTTTTSRHYNTACDWHYVEKYCKDIKEVYFDRY